MPRIGHLTAALAQETDLSLANLNYRVRLLRESGLVSQHGRGRNAAKATFMDAAMLCLAYITADDAKDCPVNVARFAHNQLGRMCRFWDHGPYERYLPDYLHLVGLDLEHDFASAIAQIIKVLAQPDGDQDRRHLYIDEHGFEVAPDADGARKLVIAPNYQFNRVEITADRPSGLGSIQVWEGGTYIGKADYPPSRPLRSGFPEGGYEITRTLTLDALYVLAERFSEDLSYQPEGDE